MNGPPDPAGSPDPAPASRGRAGSVVGVLLAGGASVRMGRDKGAIVVDGETFGARAVRALRAACERVVCVGHGRGVPDDVDIERIHDPMDGPLVALATALETIAADVYVVMPVDMPDIDGALLQALAHNATAVVAIDEPMPVALRRTDAQAIVTAVQRGERRFGDAIRALSPAVVALPAGRDGHGEHGKIPGNINDPAALAEWVEWVKARSGR